MPRYLVAFDFDYTIINDNSDTAIVKLLGSTKIPAKVKALHKLDGWTAYMQGIFGLLHAHHVKEEEIREVIQNITPVDGMCELIETIYSSGHEIIIISDSNSYFINAWLKKYNLLEKISKIYTNPAHFIDDTLTIAMYHLQTTCKLSTKNLCKGQILDSHIEKAKLNDIVFDRVIYCGDGVNDFCPMLRLDTKDFACARASYKCIKLIQDTQKGLSLNKTPGELHQIQAQVLVWETGYDIIKRILD